MAAAHQRRVRVGGRSAAVHGMHAAPDRLPAPSSLPAQSTPIPGAAAEARISFLEADPIAALDALRGTSVVALDFLDCVVIPASTLSHHPSLTRLYFEDSAEMTPLRDLAGFTQLHGLRELVYKFERPDPPRHQLQLQHALPLSQLEVLDIDGMQIDGAESTLTALTRLRELKLGNSDLRTVPANMASLTRMTSLSLGAAQGAGGWQHLPLQLEYLEIVGNDEALTTLPPELSRLSRLTQLYLFDIGLDNAGMDVALPANLQSLVLSHNNLTVMPAALAPLTGLTELDLDGNQLAGGWQHLVGLKQLAALLMRGCRLTSVPEVLSQLTDLTSVDVRGNPIASGWQHLSLLQPHRFWAGLFERCIHEG